MKKLKGNNFGRLMYSEKFAKFNEKTSVPETNDDWRKYPYDVGELHFPRDEGKHDYKHEWWYINLHLINSSSGKKYDVMVSYFPKQEQLPIPMRMFMITDIEKKQYLPQKKHDFGTAIISNKKHNIRFRTGVQKDHWYQLPTQFAFQYSLNIDDGKNGLKLALRSIKPPLPVGGTGLVPIGIGGESYYYSLTRLNVAGFLKINRKRIPVIGKGWVDHQFGSFHQTDKVETYEWFCMQLDNNVDVICWYSYVNGEVVNPIMTYMIKNNIVEVPDDFKIEVLDYWISPRLKKYSCKWRITEPKRKLDVIIKPVIPNQLSYVPYPFNVEGVMEIYLIGLYEGSTNIEGSFDGKSVRGVGYAELTHSYS